MMQVYVPFKARDEFLRRGYRNLSSVGSTVDTLCYFIGYVDSNETFLVKEIIFPQQADSASYVDNLGCWEIDTLTYITEHSDSYLI